MGLGVLWVSVHVRILNEFLNNNVNRTVTTTRKNAKFLVSGKIPDNKNFKNGSNDGQNWEADDTDGNDTGMSSHNNGHVKFDTPKVPVIFVLGM